MYTVASDFAHALCHEVEISRDSDYGGFDAIQEARCQIRELNRIVTAFHVLDSYGLKVTVK